MKLHSLPYHIGSTETPSNPGGLPSTFPFEIRFDPSMPGLVQMPSSDLESILKSTYVLGQQIGTPLAECNAGKPYADDFLKFIHSSVKPTGRALEIGAGVGYLSRRLNDVGWDVVSIEPGMGYAAHWEKYDISVVNEFFPSPLARGPFDLIVAYAVVEHLCDPCDFIQQVREHLAPNGIACFSVPNCNEEIESGDPAILIHEHVTFFNKSSLKSVITKAGLKANVRESEYGRCLYATAKSQIGDAKTNLEDDLIEIGKLQSYPDRCIEFISRAKQNISSFAKLGTIGIYCPIRALALLERDMSMRFFDDDPKLTGRYLPPFCSKIENRKQLLESPVDTLIIMSRTFGSKIRTSLISQSYSKTVKTINDL